MDPNLGVIATLNTVPRHAATSDALRQQVIADSLAGAPSAERDWLAKSIIEDASAHLGDIEVPVVVVAGEFDRVGPVRVMQSNAAAKCTAPGWT